MGFEFDILNFIQEYLRNPFFDMFFSTITHLGDSGIFWILVGIILLAFKKTRKYGVLYVLGLLLSELIVNIGLKPLVMRQRPCWINPIELLVESPKDYSFPSGHTNASFAAAYSILKINKKYGIAAYILSIIIAFSRLYLYVHFPTDVLVGGIIGTLSAIVIWKLYDKGSFNKLFEKLKL